MIPAYILHPQQRRRLEAPDPQSNVDIGAGTADLVWYTPKQYFLPR